MKTPAQRVQEDIDLIMQGILSISLKKVELIQAMGEALVNANQALKNFQEIERLTRNTERLN